MGQGRPLVLGIELGQGLDAPRSGIDATEAVAAIEGNGPNRRRVEILGKHLQTTLHRAVVLVPAMITAVDMLAHAPPVRPTGLGRGIVSCRALPIPDQNLRRQLRLQGQIGIFHQLVTHPKGLARLSIVVFPGELNESPTKIGGIAFAATAVFFDGSPASRLHIDRGHNTDQLMAMEQSALCHRLEDERQIFFDIIDIAAGTDLHHLSHRRIRFCCGWGRVCIAR